MNSVASNIKHYRLEKNITQADMAEALGVSKNTVSGWESGRIKPDKEQLERIAEFLDVPFEDLIYDGETKKTKIRYVTRYITVGSKGGIGFGAVLAMIISYVEHHSIGWAILHGILNWFYVIYFLIKNGI